MVERLKKRADFLRCAKAADAAKAPRPTLILQGRKRAKGEMETDAARIGFTVTKKVGNAVIRNRVRRRLKEAVRLAERATMLSDQISPYRPDTDYVVIGRLATLTASFATIEADLTGGLKTLHRRLDDGTANRRSDSARSTSKKDKKPRITPSQ